MINSYSQSILVVLIVVFLSLTTIGLKVGYLAANWNLPRQTLEKLKTILEEGVKEFADKNKFPNAAAFCKSFNNSGVATAHVIPYGGRLYACSLSFTDGPLIHVNETVATKVFGIYLMPWNM